MSKVQQVKSMLLWNKFVNLLVENPFVNENDVYLKVFKECFKKSLNDIREKIKDINLIYKQLDEEGEDEQV